jgi:carbon-monoxide dehydrogenase small subunit
MRIPIALHINRQRYELEIEPGETLLDVLRRRLGLTGTKDGCAAGDCGACTVLVDGVAFNACLLLAARVQGKSIETVEGICQDGRWHPLQSAFMETGALQCGYCTPGTLMSAKALLQVNPDPSEEEIRMALAGNLCRCTGYNRIVEAVRLAASRMRAATPSADVPSPDTRKSN